MARARWYLTAAQMAQFHNANSGKGKRKLTAADFNPFEKKRTPVKVPVSWLHQFVRRPRA